MSPMRARRLCAYPGCSELVRGSDRYCDAHDKELRREFEKNRPTATQRGYGYRWQKLRKMVLNEEPVCPDPYGLHPGQVVATSEVDHITPKRSGGDDSRDNLQALCKGCHSHKTAVEDGGWGKGYEISTAS